MARTSQEQVKVKIPLHLRLTYEDWRDCFKALTRAELGVFLTIRTLDPYGDRELVIDCKELGEELGLHRTSVSRALESLSQKQLIDMEIVKAKVKQKIHNCKLTLLTRVENQSNNEQEEDKQSCAPTHTSEHPRTGVCTHAHNNPQTPRQTRLPKPLILLQTIQTLFRLSQKTSERIF